MYRKKSPAKATKKKAKKVGPSVGDRIVKAVSASKERSGVSLPALKVLAADGYDVEKTPASRSPSEACWKREPWSTPKGIGASGSFKIAKVTEVYPGEDGHVRKLQLLISESALDDQGKRLTKQTYLARPIHKTVTLLEAE
uniref:H15 domain-containing protein n=1 Tax=Gadus morhua TaxID=8049 RepID=A0A8C5AX15_GADMO